MWSLPTLRSRLPSPQAVPPPPRRLSLRSLTGQGAFSRRGAAAMAVSYLSAEEVKAILEGSERWSADLRPPDQLAKTAIVDVRDEEEVAGGFIKGSTHIVSSQFMDDRGVDAALETLAGKDRIIVHCALSQQRGPKCARRIQERLDRKAGNGAAPKVQILERGFNGFYQLYGDVPTLVVAPKAVGA